MQQLFDQCVSFLHFIAPYFGMNYVEINIWLFVIIQPALIVLFAVLWLLNRKPAHSRHIKSLRI